MRVASNLRVTQHTKDRNVHEKTAGHIVRSVVNTDGGLVTVPGP